MPAADLPLRGRRLYFVGIGGSGMSGIAEVLHNLGYKVQGSDVAEGANTRRIAELGMKVMIGHRAENVGNAQVVVVSSAVKKDNPEVLAARTRHVPVVRRAEMLGELMRLSPYSTLTDALAGTFRDPRLRQLFARYATYCGSSPYAAPATLMLVAHVEREGVWLIEGGKRTRPLKKITYQAMTTEFWGSCDGLAGKDHWAAHGTPNCGKGEPNQGIHTGHASPACLFTGVSVFGGDAT